MPFPQSRIPFSVENPYRPVRPATSRIQFISVAEDAVHTKPKFRTAEQAKMLSKARPKQLVERIEQFILEKNDIYQFSQYPDDEFWIVVDVDKNWSDEVMDPVGGKTYRDEWNEAISVCEEKGYGYAVSNPFLRYGCCCTTMCPTKKIKRLP